VAKLPPRLAKAASELATEATKKAGRTYADLTKEQQNQIRRGLTGGLSDGDLMKRGFSRPQIAAAREELRVAGKTESLRTGAARAQAKTAAKAESASKKAKKTVVETGEAGTMSVAKKPSIALSRPKGTSMADFAQNQMSETKVVGKGARGEDIYERSAMKLKNDKPTRAEQRARGQVPVTKSESGVKADIARKEKEARMMKGAEEATMDGDMEEFFGKLPGGEKRSLITAAAGSESKLRQLIGQRMRDAAETGAELRRNYKKGGVVPAYNKGGYSNCGASVKPAQKAKK